MPNPSIEQRLVNGVEFASTVQKEVILSDEVIAIITAAADQLPPHRKQIQVADLLYAASTRGRAQQLLSVLDATKTTTLKSEIQRIWQQARDPQVAGSTIAINNQEYALSFSAQSLLLETAERFGNQVVSDQIIITELLRPGISELSQILTHLQISTPGGETLLRAFSNRIQGGEGQFRKATIENPIILQVGLNALEQPLQPSREPEQSVIIPAAENQPANQEQPYLRKQWIKELVANLDHYSFVALVTEQVEEADQIVRGLASQIAHNGAEAFKITTVVMVDPVAMEMNPLQTVRNALTVGRGGVVYIPDIHQFFTDTNGFNPQIAQEIRIALARREVKILTTLTEKQGPRVSQLPAFERTKFLFVEPPSVDEATEMIAARIEQIESRISSAEVLVSFDSETIKQAVILAARYYQSAQLPGSAIQALQRAATNKKIESLGFLSAEQPERNQIPLAITVTTEDVANALEEILGIEISPEDPERYLQMEDEIRKGLVGQDETLEKIADAIRSAKAGMKDPKRPIGSFMFLGPTGVGKTELGKKLAEFLFGDENQTIQLNMSEYTEKNSVSRLFGAPPGYVGYDAGGQLTEQVRRKPYSVVIFDEIEKAHPEVWNTLLQIMEEGKMTDGQGRTIDFRNTVIIMTGNVGSEFYELLSKAQGEDVESEDDLKEKIENAVLAEAKQVFRPEFLNRLSELAVFNTLKPEHIRLIVGIQLKKLNKLLAEQGLKVEADEAVLSYLTELSYDPAYGARPVRGTLQNQIQKQVARKILSKDILAGDTIQLTLGENNQIIFTKSQPAAENESES